GDLVVGQVEIGDGCVLGERLGFFGTIILRGMVAKRSVGEIHLRQWMGASHSFTIVKNLFQSLWLTTLIKPNELVLAMILKADPLREKTPSTKEKKESTSSPFRDGAALRASQTFHWSIS